MNDSLTLGNRLWRRMLFDRARDPDEHRNVALERPVISGLLGSILIEQLQVQRKQVSTNSVVLDREMEDHLRALGYLD